MRKTTLGEIAQWGSGGTPRRGTPEYFGTGMPWVSIADLNDGVVTAARESLTAAGLANSSAKVVPVGTILVAMYGSIGKLGIAGGSLCTSQAIAFAQPDEAMVDPRFLFHFLLAQRSQLQARGRGGTQMNIGQADLKEWPISLPALEEQRRIAAILDEADAIRAKRRQVLAHLDALTQAIFHDMFSRQKWPTRPLAEVVADGTIVTYGIVQAGPEYLGGVPYIRTGDMGTGYINVATLARTHPDIAAKFERSRVRAGDIVMSIRATVGTTAVVPPEADGANLTQGTARISPGRETTGDYLIEYLRSPPVQRWLQGQVKGATFREITLGRLRELEVVVPPLSIQETFAARAARISTGRVVLVDAIARADQLFASLRSRAFKGAL